MAFRSFILLVFASIIAAAPIGVRSLAYAQAGDCEPNLQQPADAILAGDIQEAAEAADEGFSLGRFAWGLAKGAVVGLAAGVVAGAVIATAPAWVTGVVIGGAVAAAGYGIYSVAKNWDNMSGGDKSELGGELIGGIFTGGLGASWGKGLGLAAKGALTSRGATVAANLADDALRVGEQVMVPRTGGGVTEGVVTGIDDGLAAVEFPVGGGQIGTKTVPVESLTRAPATTSTAVGGSTGALGEGGTSALAAAVERAGLQPVRQVTVGNARYGISKPFDMGGGRLGVLAVVDDGTTQVARVFYRSNSQGTWRVLPAKNEGLGQMGLPGYDKGIGEFALEVPSVVEAELAGLVARGEIVAAGQADDAVRAAVRTNRTIDDYMAYAENPTSPKAQTTKVDLIPDDGGPRLPTGHRGYDLRPPQSVRIPAGQAPDFGAGAVRTYRTSTSLSGEVEAMVYRSVDGTVEYTVFRNAQNQIWYGKVTTNGQINNLGVASRAVDPGELTMPLYEYGAQIPRGYAGAGHPSNPSYNSAWNYIREMPSIQEWYTANGVPMPGPG